MTSKVHGPESSGEGLNVSNVTEQFSSTHSYE